MNLWNKVVNSEKLLEIFNEYIDFHDAEITKVKYDNNIAEITIDLKGFLKTYALFSDEYKKYENIFVNIKFKNISLFDIDYDFGMNLINEINLSYIDNKFIVIIESYYLKIICDEIIIENINVIYKESNDLLNKCLKNNI